MKPILFTKTRTGYTIAGGRATIKVDEFKAHGTAHVTLFTMTAPGQWEQHATTQHQISAAYGKAKRLLNNNR